MKSNTTPIWFLLAVLLAAAIWFLNKQVDANAPKEIRVLAGLHADKVTSVHIIPAGAWEIAVTRSNQTWQLEKPIVYPAQAVAVEALLGALEKLSPTVPLSAADLNGRKDADAEFGFDNPQFTIDVQTSQQAWHLRVGNKTAPGDGLYVREAGSASAFVTDPNWLQMLPHDVNEWRDTTLVDVPGVVDWIVVTNGTKAIELRRDATNHLWRMVRPLQCRADSLRIVTGLQQLRAAKVTQFVSDDPKADLTGYGLDAATLDIWLGAGTNLLSSVHAGKDTTANPAWLFARRNDGNTIVTTVKEALAPWRGTVNDFRDPNLLEITAPVAEIEVCGENNFTLQQPLSNLWVVAGEKFSTQPESVTGYLRTLGNLRIADFVQDVVTGPGLQKYGLDNPKWQVTLRSAIGDTNHSIAQLLFGGTNGAAVYVKRGGEDFVYDVPQADLSRINLPGDYFRGHHIWHFSETNVSQVTLQQNGKTRVLQRTGTNAWTLASGQGIIFPPAIEETVHQLGELTALAWIGRKFTDEQIGRGTNGLSVTIELKSGEKYFLEFGQNVTVPTINAPTALAAVTLNGERWAFIFPPVLFPLVVDYLTIPPDKP